MRKRSRATIRFIKTHFKTISLWSLAAGFSIGGLFFLWAASLTIPDLSSLQNRVIPQSLKIYDRSGEVLLYDLSKDVQRTIVPLSEISPNIQHATIAVEDPNFYNHHGIELRGILRAVFVNITGFGLNQGGSTITQQVVKNAVLTSDKTITRKLKEWVLAPKIEQILSKEQILELYLNQAPYGGSMYGAEEASRTFFGVSAKDVTLVEAAYLAAVLPAPTYYSPYGNHREALDARKNLVLEKMYEHGFITKEERDAAKQQTVEFKPRRTSNIAAPHFVFYVEQYLEDTYGPNVLEQSGWKITTTLDANLQVQAEEIVRAGALKNSTEFNASNASLIAINPKNGNILAMVGSRNYFDQAIDGAYNVAVSLPGRQPGSTFKPFAYAKAFEKGYTPETVVFDLPTQFSTTCAPDNLSSDYPCYSPGNYDGTFRGPITLRNAIAQSINVPAVKVLYLAGIRETLQLAKAMGISTLNDPDRYGLTLVLGGGEVTLLDITSAYGVFAQNGIRYAPIAVLKVEDSNGNVIEDHTQPVGVQVIPQRVSEQINDVLSDPIARIPLGNTALNFPGRDVAVKTGTTNDYRDAWTIGYTPSIVIGIWAGNNDNSPMVKKVSGLIVGPMWHDVMNYALQQTPPESFTRSDEPTSNLKPVLRGIWQGSNSSNQNGMEHVVQQVHDILFWVDKSNPTGPIPSNPEQDPQFILWDTPVRAWALKNGYIDGQDVIVGAAQSPSFLPSL